MGEYEFGYHCPCGVQCRWTADGWTARPAPSIVVKEWACGACGRANRVTMDMATGRMRLAESVAMVPEASPAMVAKMSLEAVGRDWDGKFTPIDALTRIVDTPDAVAARWRFRPVIDGLACQFTRTADGLAIYFHGTTSAVFTQPPTLIVLNGKPVTADELFGAVGCGWDAGSVVAVQAFADRPGGRVHVTMRAAQAAEQGGSADPAAEVVPPYPARRRYELHPTPPTEPSFVRTPANPDDLTPAEIDAITRPEQFPAGCVMNGMKYVAVPDPRPRPGHGGYPSPAGGVTVTAAEIAAIKKRLRDTHRGYVKVVGIRGEDLYGKLAEVVAVPGTNSVSISFTVEAGQFDPPRSVNEWGGSPLIKAARDMDIVDAIADAAVKAMGAAFPAEPEPFSLTVNGRKYAALDIDIGPAVKMDPARFGLSPVSDAGRVVSVDFVVPAAPGPDVPLLHAHDPAGVLSYEEAKRLAERAAHKLYALPPELIGSPADPSPLMLDGMIRDVKRIVGPPRELDFRSPIVTETAPDPDDGDGCQPIIVPRTE